MKMCNVCKRSKRYVWSEFKSAGGLEGAASLPIGVRGKATEISKISWLSRTLLLPYLGLKMMSQWLCRVNYTEIG